MGSSGPYGPLGAPVVVRFPVVDGARDAGREVQVREAIIERLAPVVVVVGLRRIGVAPPRNQQKVDGNSKDDK
jgi:hypothetical protein